LRVAVCAVHELIIHDLHAVFAIFSAESKPLVPPVRARCCRSVRRTGGVPVREAPSQVGGPTFVASSNVGNDGGGSHHTRVHDFAGTPRGMVECVTLNPNSIVRHTADRSGNRARRVTCDRTTTIARA
jgi:hypothetical protein